MKEFLPIGSIVRLSTVGKRLMIAGILQMEEGNEGVVHDYVGLPYPEGFLGRGITFLFDEHDIKEVQFRGFEDEDRDEFIKVVHQVLALSEAKEITPSHDM